MNDKNHAAAEKFTLYGKISRLDQWRFRRQLRWVIQDAVSLDLMLDFEKQLNAKSSFSWKNFPILMNALRWYNRECQDGQIKNPWRRDRMPELLQIVLLFLAKRPNLHPNYREAILNIINVSDRVEAEGKVYSASWFRLYAAQVISNLSQHWEKWNPYLNEEMLRIQISLERMAIRVNNLQLFEQFQQEATKALSKVHTDSWVWDPYPRNADRVSRYLTGADRTLGYLETIATQVPDSQSCSFVFQKVAPHIGLEATASLIATSANFQEFATYYQRIAAQLAIWGEDYSSLFRRRLDSSEISQLLHFLETLAVDPRLQKCIQYNESKNTKHSAVAPKPLNELRTCCMTDKWKDSASTGRDIDNLIRQYVENIVGLSLSAVWTQVCSKAIRWEFDGFTEYVPYEARTLDWTTDSMGTRKYWNWHMAAHSEEQRFRESLGPRLGEIFNELDFTDYDLLVQLIPCYITTQSFTKVVKVPIAWEKDFVWEEAYQLHIGFYNAKVEIARPKSFVEHPFTFERPALQLAVELLSSLDQVRQTIQVDKNVPPRINS